MAVAEKVYDKRETEEQKKEKRKKMSRKREREDKRDKRQEKSLTKTQMERVLLAAEAGSHEKGRRPRPKLGKNQCASCKEEGHWARECPKNRNKRETSVGLGRKPTSILAALEEDSD